MRVHPLQSATTAAAPSKTAQSAAPTTPQGFKDSLQAASHRSSVDQAGGADKQAAEKKKDSALPSGKKDEAQSTAAQVPTLVAPPVAAQSVVPQSVSPLVSGTDAELNPSKPVDTRAIEAIASNQAGPLTMPAPNETIATEPLPQSVSADVPLAQTSDMHLTLEATPQTRIDNMVDSVSSKSATPPVTSKSGAGSESPITPPAAAAPSATPAIIPVVPSDSPSTANPQESIAPSVSNQHRAQTPVAPDVSTAATAVASPADQASVLQQLREQIAMPAPIGAPQPTAIAKADGSFQGIDAAKSGPGAAKDKAASSDIRGRRKADDEGVTSLERTVHPDDGDRTGKGLDLNSRGTTGQGSVEGQVPEGATAVSTSAANPASASDPKSTDTASAAVPVPVNSTPVPETPAMTAISSAHLVQSIQKSEMRVGMNSAEFGAISISTSVSHQVLSAQISLEHADLGRALSLHLPNMEEKLGQAYGLQTRVEIRDGSVSSQGAPQQQPREGSQGRSNSAADIGSKIASVSVAARTNASTLSEGSRLDIRI